MKLKSPYFIFLISIFLFSCNSNRWDADVSKSDVTLDLKRFDLKLYELSKEPFTEKEWIETKQQFPKFAPLFVEGIMRFGKEGSGKSIQTFQKFLSDEDMKGLFEKVAKTYPEGSLKAELEELNKAFQLYHYYFPKRVVPEIRTFVSAFSYSTVAADSLLGIGLDSYLGADYEIYSKIGIPKYKFRHFSKEYITADAMKAWLITEFEPEGSQNLLEQMIFQGKVLYLLSAFLPDLPPQYYLDYNKEDLEWCRDNEEAIWFHFVDMQLLHSVENIKIRKYLGDAPFITGFPKGSPGKVGQWVGLQIIKSYMNNNRNIDLVGLMKHENADIILQESKYKPRR